MMKRGFKLAAFLAAACLAGCGGGGKYGSPEATLEALRAASEAGDKAAAMECVSGASRKKLAEMHRMFDEFADAHPELAGKIKRKTPLDALMEQVKTADTPFGEAKVQGDKATVDIIVKRERYRHSFVRENDEWKVDLLISDDAMQWIERGLNMLLKANEGMKALGGESAKPATKD